MNPKTSATCSATAVAGPVILASLVWWVTGCGRSPSAGTQPPQEVRGAPIETAPRKSTLAPVPGPAPAPVASAPAAPTPPAAKPPPAAAPATAAANPAGPGAAGPAAGAAASTGAALPGTGSSPASGRAAPLTFEELAGYTFEVSDELLGPVTNDVAAATQKTNAQIPEKVKAYDQRKVALKGFMLPLKVEGGLVTEMLIMKDQSMCCYGTTPRINDWVSVKMKKKGVRPTMDLPVTLFGTMRIGEMRENGYLVGIYSMDGEEMDAPEIQ